MAKDKHPLDDAFNVDSGDTFRDDFNVVEIPDDPEETSLNDIIRLSMEAYRDQMAMIAFIEPKNRLKFLELSEKFLNQAKDAIYKRDLLRQKKKPTKKKEELLLEEEQPTGSVDRKSLYALKGGKK